MPLWLPIYLVAVLTAFVQYLNFDKGSVGLVLIALLSSRFRRGDRAGRLASKALVG